jgi:IstB-like ATP binding protein
MVSKAQVMALTAGDSWLEKGANLLLFGPPGGGKGHLAAAIGLALVENGWRVLFMRTSDLVQRLQIARRELALENALAKLDKYHLLILDDIVYVIKDQPETSVLFELIGTRYERRSMLITANQPFGDWGLRRPCLSSMARPVPGCLSPMALPRGGFQASKSLTACLGTHSVFVRFLSSAKKVAVPSRRVLCVASRSSIRTFT